MILSAKTIRADIVARLAPTFAEGVTPDYPTMAGARVENSRAVPFEEADLPAISVITPGSSENDFSLAGIMSGRHTERVAIIAEVTADDGHQAADLLDDFEKQIMDTLLGDLDWLAQVVVDKVDTARKIDASTGLTFGRAVIVMDLVYARNFVPRATFPDMTTVYVDTQPTSPAGAKVSDRPVLQVEND